MNWQIFIFLVVSLYIFIFIVGSHKIFIFLIPNFLKIRQKHTMRIQSMYFFHHGASLLGSTGDCVNTG